MAKHVHTPGPWRWEMNWASKSIQLSGGRPTFDKTVMDFERWGMSSAAPRFNSAITGDEFNIMYRVHDRKDWSQPFPGRDHHADWALAVTHPDAVLMAAAPTLLEALKAILPWAESASFGGSDIEADIDAARAAITLATTQREGDS